MTDTRKRAEIVSDFTDHGTGESFTAGDTPLIETGAFENYEAAGLVRTPSPAPPKPPRKPKAEKPARKPAARKAGAAPAPTVPAVVTPPATGEDGADA
jgi:hypothetical protein